MSTYYSQYGISGELPAIQGSAQTIYVPMARLAAKIVGFSILVGMIGREWTSQQIVAGAVYGPIMIVGAVGLMTAALATNALKAAVGRWMWLIAWFFAAIVFKMFAKTPYDMPLDMASWHVIFTYVVATTAGLIGLHVGADSETARWFLRRMAFILAIVSVIAFLGGSPPRDNMVEFPSRYVGFPVRMLSLLALCWYLNRWLQDRLFSRNLIGLCASATSVIVLFHKPVVFAAAIASIGLIAVQWWRGMLLRSTARGLLLVSVCAVGFFAVDKMQEGQISERYLDTVYEKFFHTTRHGFMSMNLDEMWQAAAGGRFQLWDLAMARFRLSPIFGTGVGQRLPGSKSGGSVVPLHNQYLDILCSVGIFGSIPVLIAALLWWRAALRRARGPDSDWVLPVIAFAIGTAAYNMGGTSNMFPFQSALLFFCMGMVAAPTTYYI